MNQFICNKCNFLLIITKTNIKKTVKISSPYEFLTAIRMEEVVEYDITLEKDILEAYLTKKRSKNKVELLEKYDNIISQKQITSKYNLKCNTCGENYILQPETIIYSINTQYQQSHKSTHNQLSSDNKMSSENNTLVRTKDYICPNSKCETHNNSNKKEAVIVRENSTYNTIYVCTNCKTSWNIKN